jgi:hypothetical protein
MSPSAASQGLITRYYNPPRRDASVVTLMSQNTSAFAACVATVRPSPQVNSCAPSKEPPSRLRLDRRRPFFLRRPPVRIRAWPPCLVSIDRILPTDECPSFLVTLPPTASYRMYHHRACTHGTTSPHTLTMSQCHNAPRSTEPKTTRIRCARAAFSTRAVLPTL